MTEPLLLGFCSFAEYRLTVQLLGSCRGHAFDDAEALVKAATCDDTPGFTITLEEALEEVRALRATLPPIRAPRDYRRSHYPRRAS